MKKYTGVLCGFIFFLLAGSPVLQIQADKPETIEQAYPGFASGILKGARMVPLKKGTLLVSEGIEIKESLLKDAVEKADPNLRDELRKNMFFLLEQEAIKAVLVREAESSGVDIKGLSETKIIQTYLNHRFRNIQASDDEVKAFYEINKDSVGNVPYENVKEAIRQVLIQQKKQEAFDSYFETLGRETDLKISADWVKAQHALVRDNPVEKARQSGKPTMVEFGAKGCIPCDMMQPILDSLRKKYPDTLNVVFVHVGENQILGARYGIRSIPVQVFFDKNGREVFRHVGFYPEGDVLKQLSKMGVK